jgi:hypothetical protein
VRAGHRRVRLPAAGRWGGSPVLRPRHRLDEGDPVEVITDKATVYPKVLDEVAPAAWHRTDRYANNRLEADHGQLKRRLRPMRELKTDRDTRAVIAGHALVQNIEGNPPPALPAGRADPSTRATAGAGTSQASKPPWTAHAASGVPSVAIADVATVTEVAASKPKPSWQMHQTKPMATTLSRLATLHRHTWLTPFVAASESVARRIPEGLS